MGGATVNEDQNTMDGSFILFETQSKKEIENFIASDSYTTGNVWKDVIIKRFNLAAISPKLLK